MYCIFVIGYRQRRLVPLPLYSTKSWNLVKGHRTPRNWTYNDNKHSRASDKQIDIITFIALHLSYYFFRFHCGSWMCAGCSLMPTSYRSYASVLADGARKKWIKIRTYKHTLSRRIALTHPAAHQYISSYFIACNLFSSFPFMQMSSVERSWRIARQGERLWLWSVDCLRLTRTRKKRRTRSKILWRRLCCCLHGPWMSISPDAPNTQNRAPGERSPIFDDNKSKINRTSYVSLINFHSCDWFAHCVRNVSCHLSIENWWRLLIRQR